VNRNCAFSFVKDSYLNLYDMNFFKKNNLKDMPSSRPNFRPNPTELKQYASLFWPPELTDKEKAASVIPLLLKTQDKFISILDVAEKKPDSWKNVLAETSELPANLFLKHLMVLADIGGEILKRFAKEFKSWFPNGEMVYLWNESEHIYKFQILANGKRVGNEALFVDGKSLANGHVLTEAMEDVIMLLLFGYALRDEKFPKSIAEKCIIGGFIGRKSELQRFVKQRYIVVSRITGGAKSNMLGQFAEKYVLDTLKKILPEWKISHGTIDGISHNDGKTDTNFDIVAVSPNHKYIAIEVSYQVTTNSVIERKQGQAKARADLLHKHGHKIAYVLDGAGNFERDAALRTICEYSDCTVAFTKEQIELLAMFLRGNG